MSSTSTMYTLTLHADLETPVSAYLKLRSLSQWSFLFESVEGPKHWSRYSILGFGARRVFQVENGELTLTSGGQTTVVPAKDPLAAIEKAAAQNPVQVGADCPAFVGGIFGFLAYDAVRSFEPVGQREDAPEVPDASFIEPELIAVFDSRAHTLKLYGWDEAILERAKAQLTGQLPKHEAPMPWEEPTALESRESFVESVAKAKEHIRSGDIIQVVLSRRFQMPRLADPFDVYRGLRNINPSPYLYYFEGPDYQIAGASPEVMVRVEDNRMTVRPIAGTRPRGENFAADEAYERELLADPKERAEHIMLVDLGRNDVGRVAIPGSIEIPDLMVVEHYSHVMHIVSEVQGVLKEGVSSYDALRAAFPAGTLSGAPKVRAMQIIENLENNRRGIYGGAVGYFAPNGDADFGIAIRTLVALPDRFLVQAGAGIVADSDPIKEADETEHKARAVIRAARWAASKDAAR